MVELTAPSTSHLLAVFRSLTKSGWRLDVAPATGRLLRNGQRVSLKMGAEVKRFRIFVYKVTGSGRSKPYERRVEITSTYQKGLRQVPGYTDVVLGIDSGRDLFVGVDPRRIGHGGPTGNASSFFDISGLAWTKNNEILVQPRRARLFSTGIEFHAFVKPARLAEYLLNHDQIHAGTYAGGGSGSGGHSNRTAALQTNKETGDEVMLVGSSGSRSRRSVRKKKVEAYESGDLGLDRRRKTTPEELLEIKRRAEENGRLGEEFVLSHERRALRRAHRADLADRVLWISQQSVGEGYDIRSFEVDGREKRIEVKSTSGTSRTFDMSNHEWQTCCHTPNKYYIYRVTRVRTEPSIEKVFNPMRLEQDGRVSKSPAGWRVTLL